MIESVQGGEDEDIFDCPHHSDDDFDIYGDFNDDNFIGKMTAAAVHNDSQRRLQESLCKIREKIPPLIRGLREKIALLEDEAERRLGDYQTLFEHMCLMRERALRAEELLEMMMIDDGDSAGAASSSDDLLDDFDSCLRFNYPSKSLEEVALLDRSDDSDDIGDFGGNDSHCGSGDDDDVVVKPVNSFVDKRESQTEIVQRDLLAKAEVIEKKENLLQSDEDVPMERIAHTPTKNKEAIRRRLQTLRSLK